MIQWLDSAYPPNAAQIAAAKAAGYGGWAGYFAGPNILNGWSQADFNRVRAGGLRTMAYCSGWANPASMKAQGAAWGVTICLDDEPGIRPHGTWTQPWITAAGSGQYGNYQYHIGISAAFHILAAYPTSGDPGGGDWWSSTPRPYGPTGWQWAGSHGFAGVTVDSSWFDDQIAAGAFSGATGALGVNVNASEKYALVRIANAAFAGPDHIPTDAAIVAVGDTIADDGSNCDTVIRAIQADGGSKPWEQIAIDLKAGKYAPVPGPAGPPGPQGPAGVTPTTATIAGPIIAKLS